MKFISILTVSSLLAVGIDAFAIPNVRGLGKHARRQVVVVQLITIYLARRTPVEITQSNGKGEKGKIEGEGAISVGGASAEGIKLDGKPIDEVKSVPIGGEEESKKEAAKTETESKTGESTSEPATSCAASTKEGKKGSAKEAASSKECGEANKSTPAKESGEGTKAETEPKTETESAAGETSPKAGDKIEGEGLVVTWDSVKGEGTINGKEIEEKKGAKEAEPTTEKAEPAVCRQLSLDMGWLLTPFVEDRTWS